jgi:hypothetical protein
MQTTNGAAYTAERKPSKQYGPAGRRPTGKTQSRWTGRAVGLSLGVVMALSGSAEAAWLKTFGTTDLDGGGIEAASIGGYYLYSLATNAATDQSHPIFAKLNETGTLRWSKKISLQDRDDFAIAERNDGGLLLYGSTHGASGGLDDAVWASFRVDASTGKLTPVFEKAFQGGGKDSLDHIKDEGRELLLLGKTSPSGSLFSDTDVFIAKVSPVTGDPEWSKIFHNNLNDGSPEIVRTGDGYILLFQARDFFTFPRLVLARLDNSGNPVTGFAKSLGGSEIIASAALEAISGGNYLLHGTVASPTSAQTGIFIIHLNGNLDPVWSRRYDSLSADASSALLLSGSTSSWGISQDVLAGVLNENGTVANCPFIQNATSTTLPMNIVASELNWSSVGTLLTERGPIPVQNIHLNVSDLPLTETTICETKSTGDGGGSGGGSGTPQVGAVSPSVFGLGSPVTVPSQGFGHKKGTVLIGRQAAKVLAWSDTTSVFSVSRLKAGTYPARVVPRKGKPITVLT